MRIDGCGPRGQTHRFVTATRTRLQRVVRTRSVRVLCRKRNLDAAVAELRKLQRGRKNGFRLSSTQICQRAVSIGKNTDQQSSGRGTLAAPRPHVTELERPHSIMSAWNARPTLRCARLIWLAERKGPERGGRGTVRRLLHKRPRRRRSRRSAQIAASWPRPRQGEAFLDSDEVPRR